jgi:hypothetical protein
MKNQTIKSCLTITVITLVFNLLSPDSSDASEKFLHPTLTSDGWKEIIFEDKNPNLYSVCGLDCIQIKTNSSVSMIGKLVTVDLGLNPVLNWEWKIEKQVKSSDLSVKGKDDRAIAIYVTFPYNPDTASLLERLKRPLLEIWRGSDTPSRGISYVWAASGVIGEVISSPYFGGSNAMIIARNGEDRVNSWITEHVDVVADHERIFGFSPTVASHLMISADSDDTGTRNQAFVKGLRFTKD